MENKKEKLILSTLRHTWFLDFDGTIVEHNGYKTGEDKLLPGVKEFLNSIPEEDFIIITTAREKEAKEKTEKFLKKNAIRYNQIFYEMPMGERVLINDNKPSGLCCAYCVNLDRNQGLEDVELVIDETL